MTKVKIVGMNYQHPKHKVVEGNIVKFIHETDNPVDKMAVAVLNVEGEKIGFVGTKNTVSAGNRKNGCIDNEELLQVLPAKGRVSKVRNSFGFATIL